MSSLKRYRVILNPKSPFSGEIDSIKIYGALVRAISELYGEAKSFLQEIRNGSIRVSSPMPMHDGRYYMFKPMLKTAEKINYKDFKKYKRRRFIREEYARDALKEGIYSPNIMNSILNDDYVIWYSEDLPGVFVNRNRRDTQIYYKNAMHFSDNLWILVEIGENIDTEVKAALKYLGDVGISKKRSSGFGTFKVEWKEYTHIFEAFKYRMIASKYIPNENEINSFPFEKSRYDVKLISGYTRGGSPIAPIRAIIEGSVYPAIYTEHLLGRMVDISDNYAVVGAPVVI